MRTTLGKVLSLIAPLTLLPAQLLWATAVPPTLTCPGNVQVECTGGLTPVTYDVTAVDASGNALRNFVSPGLDATWSTITKYFNSCWRASSLAFNTARSSTR